MKEGGCSLAPLGTFEGKVPADAMAKVAEQEAAIKAGTLHGRDQRRRAEVELMGTSGTWRGGASSPPRRHHQALRPAGRQRRDLPRPRRGEIVALLGENGAGKTTLMNILFGHYVADAGTVEAFGKPLPPGDPRAALAAGIGMVHQHFTLADNLTVLENIVLGTASRCRAPARPAGGARARIRELAQRVRPRGRSSTRRVGDLTVGERQRVEILKALYRDARILILDEPTAVLTPQETDALFATLRTLSPAGSRSSSSRTSSTR